MKKTEIPDPEKKISVLRRYLHILALLQNTNDPQDWNGSTLADILCRDEDPERVLTDKSVRDYIKKNLRGELGLKVDIRKGERRMSLETRLENEELEKIAALYSSFVVKDSTRSVILRTFIKKHPDDCLWLLGRIYFASICKKKITFSYDTGDGRTYKNTVHPYHLVFRNNNLYLICRIENINKVLPLIVNRISGLSILDDSFSEDLPTVDELFSDSLGSFIGKKYNVCIKFTSKIHSRIEQILSILDPEIEEIEGPYKYEARFTVSDDEYLCKQLFLYGSDVEIVSPPEIRQMMIDKLRESMRVYGG